MRAHSILAVLGMITSLPALAADKRETAAIDRFENKVRPLLAARCWQCHGPEKRKGGLRLDTAEAVGAGGDSGPVVVPGKPHESRLIEAIGYKGELKMPPKGKLSDAEIAELTEWVRGGAVWPGAGTPRPSPRNAVRRRSALYRGTEIVLGLSAAARPGSSRCESDGLANVADRSIHPGRAGEKGAGAGTWRPISGP